jgi:hypothetical protein
MSTIKILAVNTHTLYLDWIIYLMKCLPNLEKLYVQVTILYFCSVNKYTTFINIGYTPGPIRPAQLSWQATHGLVAHGRTETVQVAPWPRVVASAGFRRSPAVGRVEGDI